MRKMNINFLSGLALLFVMLAATSCTDAWDKHYAPEMAEKSSLNLYDYIAADADLSTFAGMLRVAGYDKVLSSSQTYTVWAPVNSALQDVSLNDTAKVKEIVENHIARFLLPTSGVTQKQVFMLANKIVVFAGNGPDYTFGGNRLVKGNIGTINGVLHKIDNYVPYLKNIWEFIGQTPGLDSLKKYLYSNSKFEFDLSASGKDIGTNAQGQLIYDSVFIFTNKVLNRIGQLNKEDSLYTAILPDNKAWDEALENIKKYYVTQAKDGGEARQRKYAEWALVKDLVFRQQVASPESYDSLVSTTGSVFYRPDSLFMGATRHAGSNGLMYVSNSLKYKATDSWHKEVRIEAENVSYTETGVKSNFDIFTRNSTGSGMNVSKERYVYAKNLTINDFSVAFVKFPLPNTLSATYDIYCVFLPENIVETTSKPSKVKFYVSYIDNTGKQINDAPVDAANKILASGTAGIFTTNADAPTEMFVTRITLPFSNLLDEDNKLTFTPTVRLKVENAVKRAETVSFTKDMRVDCIILKPVQ